MLGEVKIYRGDNRTLKCTARDKTTKAIIPISGATIKFTVREEPLSETAIITKSTNGGDLEIKITNGAGGLFEIYIIPADTVNKICRKYWYDIELTINTKKYTGIKSRFIIMEDVTWT